MFPTGVKMSLNMQRFLGFDVKIGAFRILGREAKRGGGGGRKEVRYQRFPCLLLFWTITNSWRFFQEIQAICISLDLVNHWIRRTSHCVEGSSGPVSSHRCPVRYGFPEGWKLVSAVFCVGVFLIGKHMVHFTAQSLYSPYHGHTAPINFNETYMHKGAYRPHLEALGFYCFVLQAAMN